MLRTATSLLDFELRARDGKIGHVKDLFFDDQQWGVRYLVVDTGGWLSGRRVLISPAAVAEADWLGRSIPVNLTMEQVKGSPGVELEQPVSREDELLLTQYYAWPSYWTMAGMADGNLGMTVPAPIVPPEAVVPVREERVAHSVVAERHLRSVAKVRGFEVQAYDGAVGPVADFVIDVTRWSLRWLLVDTQKLFPIEKVPLPPRWVQTIGWDDEKVHVALPREALRMCAPYKEGAFVDSETDAGVDAHYRRFAEAQSLH